MKTTLVFFSVLTLAIALVPAHSSAQLPPEWHDDLVDHMAGAWKVTGPMLGQTAHHDFQADWVLNHQFLRIYEKTSANAPADEHPYEATWFLGYDTISDRYVLHLFDQFGGRFTETLGYGTRDGNAIRFLFEYPDGPFHNTMRWSPEKNTWQWLMERKDKNGKWIIFGDLTLARPKP